MAIAVREIPAAKPVLCRLAGARGTLAMVGEVVEIVDGIACWKLHPAYAAWLWPLMLKATDLALCIPEALLEPVAEGDCLVAPRAPTEAEKDVILKSPETEEDAVRVHTLVLKGKPPSVRKAFPTRTVSLATLRYCRKRVSKQA